MKKVYFPIIIVIVFLVLFSGCIGGREIIISGKITAMKYHAVGLTGLDTVYDTTFDNKTTYQIRSDDFKKYGISQGDYVKLDLSQISGGDYYVISKFYVIEG